ncbi:MAG: YIP1 family protein [Desulfobacteraceae bacterium]|nr:YIP1 family protein [Desulfobacteraceae bacterium]
MNELTIKNYVETLSSMIKHPGTFFENLPKNSSIKPPLYFLCISCILSAVLFIFSTSAADYKTLTGSIYFINAVGMTFIAAFFAFTAMVLITPGIADYKKCFSIFAYSAGTTIIGAGIPVFLWFAEVWKWWLIGKGLKKNIKLTNVQTILVIAVSIGSVLFLFSIFTQLSAVPK